MECLVKITIISAVHWVVDLAARIIVTSCSEMLCVVVRLGVARFMMQASVSLYLLSFSRTHLPPPPQLLLQVSRHRSMVIRLEHSSISIKSRRRRERSTDMLTLPPLGEVV